MKGYKKYPKSWSDEFELLIFKKEISKYRYFCKSKYVGNKYNLYIKKKKRYCSTSSKVWKRNDYTEVYIHYYCGIQNKKEFPRDEKSLYDYSWEWNIFCLKDIDDIWYVRFTYYDITFGTIKQFKTREAVIKYVKKLKTSNKYGLWQLKEYKDFIVFD